MQKCKGTQRVHIHLYVKKGNKAAAEGAHAKLRIKRCANGQIKVVKKLSKYMLQVCEEFLACHMLRRINERG